VPGQTVCLIKSGRNGNEHSPLKRPLFLLVSVVESLGVVVQGCEVAPVLVVSPLPILVAVAWVGVDTAGVAVEQFAVVEGVEAIEGVAGPVAV